MGKTKIMRKMAHFARHEKHKQNTPRATTLGVKPRIFRPCGAQNDDESPRKWSFCLVGAPQKAIFDQPISGGKRVPSGRCISEVSGLEVPQKKKQKKPRTSTISPIRPSWRVPHYARRSLRGFARLFFAKIWVLRALLLPPRRRRRVRPPIRRSSARRSSKESTSASTVAWGIA